MRIRPGNLTAQSIIEMDENAMNNFSTIFHGSAHFDGNFSTGTLSEILWKHIGPGFSIFNATRAAYSTVVWKQRLYSPIWDEIVISILFLSRVSYFAIRIVRRAFLNGRRRKNLSGKSGIVRASQTVGFYRQAASQSAQEKYSVVEEKQ